MSDNARPPIEQDAALARKLGAALLVIIPVFAFYVGTVGGKTWVYDYQPKDFNPGFRTAIYGLGIALFINLIIWTYYKQVIHRDSEAEWYGPQSEHTDHH